MNQELCSILEWDTKHFGATIARIGPERLSARDLVDVLNWADQHGVKCLYWAVDPCHAESLALANLHAFRFVDMRLDMGLTTAGWHPEPHSSVLKVRGIQAGDEKTLIPLAGTSHFDTRFAKDLAFERNSVAALYERWLLKALRDGRLTVLEDESGIAAGYVTWSVSGTGETGRLELVAVAENLRGKGGGRLLIHKTVSMLVQRGVCQIDVATQASNTAAQRLYQSCGFRTKSARCWFHRWRGL